MTQPEQSACPYCEMTVPAGDYDAEIGHMITAHPEVLTHRMERAGFVWDERTGEWVDRLAGDD
jgi:hypothetical protein